MKKLTVVYVCDEILGECQGIFDDFGVLLGAWHDNDACWRNEYFSPFMAKLGYTVSEAEASQVQHKALCDWFGL